MDFSAEIILLVSGFIVGFINTIAAGAAVISLSVFMILGLPITLANGTNRLPVMFQNLTAAVNFHRQKMLDVKVGIKLSIPMVIGAMLGSGVASTINDTIFTICLGVVLIATLIVMLISPGSILKGRDKPRPITFWYYIWFLLIGFYDGYIHIGLGYMLLAATIGGLGYDIVRANALKGFMMTVVTPFSLLIFALNGQVDYYYGMLHSAGNIVGAFIASQYASRFGIKFLKWFLIAVILVMLADTSGIIALEELINGI